MAQVNRIGTRKTLFMSRSDPALANKSGITGLQTARASLSCLQKQYEFIKIQVNRK